MSRPGLDDGAGRLLWNGGGMKGEEPADARERIITSCMEVIEGEGTEALTVRAIAEEAHSRRHHRSNRRLALPGV
ncbi:hypothetical protein [Sorangium sp. So ce861]|uniref:hypothetical protein n=1 Tax=Sorangium sp. So ce861 TaxID=3133323 RepID=UPI003F5FCF01